ncbi:MAG: glycosyltransferase family 2 protein [Planctomycetota bacterium]
MFVSVIIRTYNRAEMICRVLRSVAAQRFDRYPVEVIVVDDGSTDDTPARCAEFARTLPQLRVIRRVRGGCAEARNAGIAAARGEFLLFTDDDCICEPGWIAALVDALEKHGIVAGAVWTRTDNFLKLCHNIAEFHQVMAGKPAGFITFPAGANWAWRADVIRRLGPFSAQNEIGEDTCHSLSALEAGLRIYFEPRAVVIHDPPRTSLARVFRYSACHAEGMIRVRLRYAKLLRTPAFLSSPFLMRLLAVPVAGVVTSRIFWTNRGLLRYWHSAPVVFALKFTWMWAAAGALERPASADGVSALPEVPP